MKRNHLKFLLSSHSCEFRFSIKWLSSPLKSLMEEQSLKKQSLKQNFRKEVEEYTAKEKSNGVESSITMTEKAEGIVPADQVK